MKAYVAFCFDSVYVVTLDFVRLSRNSNIAISSIYPFNVTNYRFNSKQPSSIIEYLAFSFICAFLLHIFKISESMADLPDDLNFGVNMEGSGPTVPPPKPVEAPPKPSD